MMALQPNRRQTTSQSPGRTKAIMTNEEEGNYQLLLELGAAFNAHDLDRIMGHFTEDSSLAS